MVGVVRVKVGLRPSSRIATVPEVSVVIVVVGGPEKEIKGPSINDASFFKFKKVFLMHGIHQILKVPRKVRTCNTTLV